jgi:hypothetical protein
MKYIKKFNESAQDSQSSDYDPSKGRGHSYKENLGRADNEEVYKILPELENTIGADVQALVSKIEQQVKSGKLKDSDSRNFALAIGHIAYEKMN